VIVSRQLYAYRKAKGEDHGVDVGRSQTSTAGLHVLVEHD
jgi:hypothetical protein